MPGSSPCFCENEWFLVSFAETPWKPPRTSDKRPPSLCCMPKQMTINHWTLTWKQLRRPRSSFPRFSGCFSCARAGDRQHRVSQRFPDRQALPETKGWVELIILGTLCSPDKQRPSHKNSWMLYFLLWMAGGFTDKTISGFINFNGNQLKRWLSWCSCTPYSLRTHFTMETVIRGSGHNCCLNMFRCDPEKMKQRFLRWIFFFYH